MYIRKVFRQVLGICCFVFIGAQIFAFVGCAPLPPPPPRPRAYYTYTLDPKLLHVPQDWNTFKVARINEGYTLLNVPASKDWLTAQNIDLDSGTNYQINIRTVFILTCAIGNNFVHKVLVVNDDAGNLRVFRWGSQWFPRR